MTDPFMITRRSIPPSVALRVAVLLVYGLCLCGPAAALTRQKDVSTPSDTEVHLTNHMHFHFATCQAISVPKIVIQQQPSKGKLTISEGQATLRSSSSERGQHCVGHSMRAAIVHYTPAPNASGEDLVRYLVVYPRSCSNCTNFEFVARITIGIPSAMQMPGMTADGITD
jgi:hypothetical protein